MVDNTDFGVAENQAANDEIENAISVKDENRTLNAVAEQYVQNSLTRASDSRNTRNVAPIASELIEQLLMNRSIYSISSRLAGYVCKFPPDYILSDYSLLQNWMFHNCNYYAPRNLCRALVEASLNRDPDDSDKLFYVRLICSELYHVSGDNLQAQNELEQALDQYEYVTNKNNGMKTKLKDLQMKITFQCQFQQNLCAIIGQQQQANNEQELKNLKEKFNEKKLDPSIFRYLWRDIVLLLISNPQRAAHVCYKLLFTYASQLAPTTLAHANGLYVGVNIMMIAHGSNSFDSIHHDMDVWHLLEEISQQFYNYGEQSKQFSHLHKMGHVWATAAVASYLKSGLVDDDGVPYEYYYKVCASIARVSFEFLGIQFLSSGLESLYLLAKLYARPFFLLMTNDPSIQPSVTARVSPHCIEYFRNHLGIILQGGETDCIKFSVSTVKKFCNQIYSV
ncbi:unnamed protein product [Didymodactylos carnosus]|uniref:Uncharacterized protein n=1 Tax=Didymodactylos carnosus TaxID=1234261 RepID=A0A814W3G9_9BILA|nr:unnamed protein product [Didymodactylos carnosus]CAF3957734.1 unnamed protein product [Didymodactylos carnosus]